MGTWEIIQEINYLYVNSPEKDNRRLAFMPEFCNYLCDMGFNLCNE